MRGMSALLVVVQNDDDDVALTALAMQYCPGGQGAHASAVASPAPSVLCNCKDPDACIFARKCSIAIAQLGMSNNY